MVLPRPRGALHGGCVTHQELELACIAIETHAGQVEKLMERWTPQMFLQLIQADRSAVFAHSRTSRLEGSKM